MSVPFVFAVIAFFAGLAGAFQIPTLSLFLSTELKTAPAAIGLFYMVNAAVGIGIGFGLAAFSDRLRVRRHLLMLCYLMAVFNCLLFAFNRQYWVLLFIGSFLAAVANAAMPQLFALAREYSEKPMFNALMRAQLSLAWVIGPPLAFTATAAAGFTTMYVLTAMIFLIIILLAFFLPVMQKEKRQVVACETPDLTVRKKTVLLFTTSMLMWSCSALYLIDAPVFITRQLGLAETNVGIIMGVAAAIEIPVMLLAGRYVEQIGKRRMMAAALGAGILFYGGLTLATSLWQLLLLQILNALFIGVIATVGLFFFQAALPERQGLAATLFTNSVSVGIILAGGVHVFLTQSGRHEPVYIMAGALLFTASVIVWRSDETFT